MACSWVILLYCALKPGKRVSGNRNAANFFAILGALQKRVGVTLTVRAA